MDAREHVHRWSVARLYAFDLRAIRDDGFERFWLRIARLTVQKISSSGADYEQRCEDE